MPHLKVYHTALKAFSWLPLCWCPAPALQAQAPSWVLLQRCWPWTNTMRGAGHNTNGVLLVLTDAQNMCRGKFCCDFSCGQVDSEFYGKTWQSNLWFHQGCPVPYRHGFCATQLLGAIWAIATTESNLKKTNTEKRVSIPAWKKLYSICF